MQLCCYGSQYSPEGSIQRGAASCLLQAGQCREALLEEAQRRCA
jgi:hypothetical protein